MPNPVDSGQASGPYGVPGPLDFILRVSGCQQLLTGSARGLGPAGIASKWPMSSMVNPIWHLPPLLVDESQERIGCARSRADAPPRAPHEMSGISALDGTSHG